MKNKPEHMYCTCENGDESSITCDYCKYDIHCDYERDSRRDEALEND